MNTLDKLPGGEPLKLLRELEQAQKEIKAPQTFGSTSVVTSRIFSDDDWDVELPAHDTHQVLVEFIPDDLTFGGALCYALLIEGDVPAPERLRVGSDHKQQWMIRANNSFNASPAHIKLYFFAAGSGTFTTNLV